MSANMNEAVELGYIKVNPCAGVRGLPRPAHREMLFLTADEVRALAEAIDAQYRVLVYLAAYTGLRASEIGALRWRSVDLLHGTLTVCEALKDVDGHLVFGPTKTHENRTIALPRFLCEMLNEHGVGAPDALVFRAPQVDRYGTDFSIAARSSRQSGAHCRTKRNCVSTTCGTRARRF
jgi:integrase